MKLKQRLVFLSALITMLAATPAQAGRVEPTPVSCWFFRGEKLELQQTCIYESYSWAGGGGSTLLWEDGVKTQMAWGLQGRGEKPCEEMSVDGVCGVMYFRDLTTLERISKAEGEQRQRNEQQVVRCVEVRGKSVCWL